MHTHEISSFEKNRSAADTHKGNGFSLPAAQMYNVEKIGNVDFRISDPPNMAAYDKGRHDHFFANSDARLASNVLLSRGNAPSGLEGMKELGANIPFINNCGEYANRALHLIHGLKRYESGNAKKIKGAEPEVVVPTLPTDIFDQSILAGPVNPQLGEVYLAISDPKSKEVIDEIYFNFHWATVVGQVGNDVVTAESASNASDGFFKMYNHINESQTFRQQYVFTDKKLAEAAKIYAATFHEAPKTSEEHGEIL